MSADPCESMPIELGFGEGLLLQLPAAPLAMEFEIPAQALPDGSSLSEPMRVSVCWPPVRIEYVTHQGQVVTHEGEPVYVLIED